MPMKIQFLPLAAGCLLPVHAAAPTPTPPVGRWTATSTTAMAITGDIVVTPAKITFANHATLRLTPAGTIDRFTVNNTSVQATLSRVTPPSDPSLLQGTRLCSTPPNPPVPVTWIVTWKMPPIPGMATSGYGLAAYSGTPRPASDSNPNLCGTYAYDPAP